MGSPDAPLARPASLLVIDPGGHRIRIEIGPLPFRIGRQADNHLVLRDNRASRLHAVIKLEGGEYLIEDAGSRHGTLVNGKRIERHILRSSDRIEFGVPDSYELVFALDSEELSRLMDQLTAPEPAGSVAGLPGVGASLPKLRAILELARTLQTSLSADDVLRSVVDAALAITGAERGFLLLRDGEELETRVARNRQGAALRDSDLRVPRRWLRRALDQRRELLSMNFDPLGQEGLRPEQSIADLELRSVICVPLVRLHSAAGDATRMMSAASETVGLLYMDSRIGAADLAGGNRELLQTLAIEASTILENARLLEAERLKQKIEEELRLARLIQQSLLPRQLPVGGWFRACGSSVASHQVGGDYFDVIAVDESRWAAIIADVSGKGVSSALLASLLQGAFLTVAGTALATEERLRRLNRFLFERTEGEKYATIFYCVLERGGRLRYVNAGHCPPILLRCAGALEYLDATGMPVGLIEPAQFGIEEAVLGCGDRILIYSDGVTEAQDPRGEFFGRVRLREVAARAGPGCSALHEAVQTAVAAFTDSAPQADDVTLLALEYRPG
jgi:serine phosphatase RsbU (regulator of sigma subunit)